MSKYEELYKEAEQIQSTIECICSDDPNELYARLSDLNTFLARTSQMYAEARQLLNEKRARLFVEREDILLSLSATIANKYLEANTAEEGKLADWIERLNKAIVHQSDNLRSMFSYVKEQLRLTKNGY